MTPKSLCLCFVIFAAAVRAEELCPVVLLQLDHGESSAVISKDSKDFPGLGGLINSVAGGVSGALTGVVNGAINATVEKASALADNLVSEGLLAAASKVNASLETVGDLLLDLQGTVKKQITSMQATIDASPNKIPEFQIQVETALSSVSSKLNSLSGNLLLASKTASQALILLGQQAAATQFQQAVQVVMDQTSDFKSALDSSVQAIKGPHFTAQLGGAVGVPIAALYSAADSLQNVSASMQSSMDEFASAVLAGLAGKVPESALQNAKEVLQGVSAQAAKQLAPLAQIAQEVAEGVAQSAEKAGIAVTRPPGHEKSSPNRKALIIGIAVGAAAALVAVPLVYMTFFASKAPEALTNA